MKKLLDIVPENISSALGWTLIHSAWQGIAIVLVFGALRYYFKTSHARYWQGIGALGLQLVSAIATFFIVYQPADKFEGQINNAQLFKALLQQTNNVGQLFTPAKLSLTQQAELFLRHNLDTFVLFWFVGATLLLLRLAVGFTYVQRLKVQHINPISADIQLLMDNLLDKIQIATPIKLLESAKASVPMTIGWLKPVILLPAGIITGLTVKQLEAVLAHELAHIKRYDYLINIFQSFVEILFFYHPSTWWISGKVRDERENCCDDFAVEICGDKLILAKALTQVATFQQQPRLAMAFGAKRQTFMDRIKRIVGINDAKPMSYGNWAVVLGMVLVMALGVVYAQKEVAQKEKSAVKSKVVDNTKTKQTSSKTVFSKIQNRRAVADTSTLDEAEKEMERLSKEMEKYSEEMEKYSRQIEDKYSRQMEKHSAEMEEISRKMRVPQRKMENLSIDMEELSLARRKIERQYRDTEKMPADAEQKMRTLEKKERDLQQQMQQFEEDMQKVEEEMRPIERKMNRLNEPMDSLQRLMERYQRPMDSLSRIMEEKGKVLEKLAKEEEIRFKQELENFSEMLLKEGLIKDKEHYELRLKDDKLLINLEPQPAAVYQKVWGWIEQTWSKRHPNIKEKNLRIEVNGDNVNFSMYGDNSFYRVGRIMPPIQPVGPVRATPRVSPMPTAPIRVGVHPPRVAPTPNAPIRAYPAVPRVAPTPAIRSPRAIPAVTPVPPRPSRVGAISQTSPLKA